MTDLLGKSSGYATPFPNGANLPEGKLYIDNVAVTPSAAEINKLDGMTASKDELNILDGVTATKDEINVLAGIASGAYIIGQKFQISFPNIAAASVGKAFFVALAPCKVIEAQEVHGTVCDAADTMTIEKCATGEDAGAGDVVLAEAFTLNSTANTPVVKAAVTTAAATLSRGDSLMLKYASGDGTSYAEGCVTVALQYV